MKTQAILTKLYHGVKDAPELLTELQRKTPDQYDYGQLNQLEALIGDLQNLTRKAIETRVYLITSKNQSR